MPAPAYDETNIFAKILRGELPCHKVYEDDVAFAFMDIMPRADGHVLVLPKSPARNILDADPAILGKLIAREFGLQSRSVFVDHIKKALSQGQAVQAQK